MLATVDPARFQVIVIETDGADPAKDAKAVSRIEQAGLRAAPPGVLPPLYMNRVFLSPSVQVLGALPVNGTKVRTSMTALSRASLVLA